MEKINERLLLFFCLLIFSAKAISQEKHIEIVFPENRTTERISDYIPVEDMPKVTSLKLSGSVNEGDMIFIEENMCGSKYNDSKTDKVPAGSLETLDLSEALFPGNGDVFDNPRHYYCIGINNCLTLKTVYLPNRKNTVLRGGFENCANLINVAMNGTILLHPVETVNLNAFNGCSNLKNIYLNKEQRGENLGYCFRCDNFEEFIIDEENPYITTLDGAVISKDGKTLYAMPNIRELYRVPDVVTEIYERALGNNLKTLCLGKNVTNIGVKCFYKLSKLDKIIVTSTSIPKIEKGSYDYFDDCNRMQSNGILYVPEGTKNEFLNAAGWNTIKDIREYNPADLESLLTVSDEDLYEPVDYDFRIGDLYYTVTSLDDFTVTVQKIKSGYSGDINVPATVDYKGRTFTVTSINKMNEPGITSITLPNTIRSIGSGAFSETNIKEFYMPDCVEEIGSRLFAFCRSLENVVISKNINKLSDEMFLCCYKLNDIDWQPAKGTFGRNAFKECQGLTSITIPQNMNFSYDGATFTYCSNIETLTIEDSSEKLRFDYNSWRGDYGDIYECEFNKSKIKTLYLGRPYDVDYDLSSFGRMYIYPNFNNLENLAIGSKVTELEYWPNVNNLRTLDIGTNLNNVTDFSENTSLEKIIVRSNVPPTAEGFSNATYLNAVLYVPQGAKDIYMQTPIWKYFFNIEEISSTGIGSISPMENVGDDVYYSIDGRRIAAPRKGINIIRKANGTVKKVLIK